MADDPCREAMLRIAKDYELIAQRAQHGQGAPNRGDVAV